MIDSWIEVGNGVNFQRARGACFRQRLNSPRAERFKEKAPAVSPTAKYYIKITPAVVACTLIKINRKHSREGYNSLKTFRTPTVFSPQVTHASHEIRAYINVRVYFCQGTIQLIL